MWQYLILVILSIFLYHFYQSRKKFAELARKFRHGILSLPFFGVSYLFLGNNERRMKALQALGLEGIKRGGIVADWFGPLFYIVVSDPEFAAPLMKSCLHKDEIMAILRYIVGNGNISAPVPIWRSRRRVLIPTFTSKNLNEFMNTFVKQNEILAERLKEKAGAGQFAMWDYISTANMDTISEAVLGVKLNTQRNPDHPFINTFTEVSSMMTEWICQPWLHSKAVYKLLPRAKRLKYLKDILYKVVDEVIGLKRKELEDIKHNKEPNPKRRVKPFMELLIELSTEDGEQYTDIQLREEVLVLMIAGMDTSATTAGFVFKMLADHPDEQEKVFKELKEVFGDSDRQITVEDLRRLEYLEAFIKETMRMYAPVPVVLRKVVEDFTLPNGIKIPAGCGVLINIWAMHRNPKYWGPDAEQFRPERFLGEPLKHPAQFIPFSYGPRGCIGNRYAMMLLKTAMATIARRFKVLPADNKPMRLTFEIFMKDIDHYKIQLESRR